MVLVMVFVAALFVMTFATFSQGSTTSRSYARAVLTRTYLEAAESAFSETASVIRESLKAMSPVSRSSVNWKQELLPPYNCPSASPRTIIPEKSREVLGTAYGVVFSDVEVMAVNCIDLTGTNALVKGHGTLEFKVTMTGAMARIRSSKTVRQRLQFFCRHKPIAEWPPPRPTAYDPRAPVTLENSDVVLLNSPLGTTIE